MTTGDKPILPSGHRPRPKGFLRLDLDNAYARLGVSPLTSADDIADRIADLRGKANRAAKAAADPAAKQAAEEEIHRLDKIFEDIGAPLQRERYDERFPQNILLTVQPGAAEQAWRKHRRAGLISEWLREGLAQEGLPQEGLAQDAFLPSPGCLRLWAPAGLSPLLRETLAAVRETPPHPASGQADTAALASFEQINLTVEDLATRE